MISNLIFIVLICFSNYQFIENLDCYDELNSNPEGTSNLVPTDFSLTYRPPFNRLEKGYTGDDRVYNRPGYFYKTYSDDSDRFLFKSRLLFENVDSLFQSVITQFYEFKNSKKISYIAYSELKKDDLVWNYDDVSAIWLIHSNNQNMEVRFPSYTVDWMTNKPNQYLSQHSFQEKKGLLFLCLKIRYDDLITILKHLVIRKIKIYSSHYAYNRDAMMVDDAIYSIYEDPIKLKMKPRIIKKYQYSDLVTPSGLNYKIITYSFKDRGGFWNMVANKLKCQKIYIKSSDVLKKASFLQLITRKPNCEKFRLIDIENIAMERIVNSETKIPIQWNYGEDMSKYGICEGGEKGKNYICISNLNRNPYNFNEAGSVVCFSHVPLYQSFKSIRFGYNCIPSKNSGRS